MLQNLFLLNRPLGSGNFLEESAFCALLDDNIYPKASEADRPHFLHTSVGQICRAPHPRIFEYFSSLRFLYPLLCFVVPEPKNRSKTEFWETE